MTRRLLFVLLGSLALLNGCVQGSDPVLPSANRGEVSVSSGLPLPSGVTSKAFQEQLYGFLEARKYLQLGWKGDKGIRDTGPYQNGVYYGTHPAVRVYYSPEVIAWLEGGQQTDLPDGSMIVKEMFPPPAIRYDGQIDVAPAQWTAMIRDKNGAHDGWYWSYYGKDQPPDSDDPPFNYPNSGFGLYCVRCHASAESLLTFASTENIEGFPGQPKSYPVDNSWISDSVPEPVPHPSDRHHDKTERDAVSTGVAQALAEGRINAEFLAYFDQFPAQSKDQIAKLPPVTKDHVVAKAHRQFTTSDQCMSCHAGDNSNFGPNMIKDNTDISPWGEWSWSMMALAGRDPIFYAQLESEIARFSVPGGDFNAESIANLCLRCHGVMGQRQYSADHPGQNFSLADALSPASEGPEAVYGGLARDGVSCTVCHQIPDQSGLPLANIETGQFSLRPPVDGLLSIFGPFEHPSPRPMVEALAMLPVKGDHLKDSLLCASCHTVKLPVLNDLGKTVASRYEQATYLEWQNSAFGRAGTQLKSCQECHMAGSFHDEAPLEFKVANIQDQDFPEAHGVAPLDEITVRGRPDYTRHDLAGINVFALELFRQFPEVLGVKTKSFMTGFENGLDNSVRNSLAVAAKSARLDITSTSLEGGQLEAKVKVTNLVGHRFPSGVGFRRLLLQVVVKDASGAAIWSSGRTNSLGLVVDDAGRPLPSETGQIDPATGEAMVEPHHQVVDSPDQAQIYGVLERDTEGHLTTSFLGAAEEVKDNRLLPKGWSREGAAGMHSDAVEATHPVGSAAEDNDFVNGTGSDVVTYRMLLPASAQGPFTIEASLAYQAIPPFYLNDRFDGASGEATRRLHYMGSRLDLSRTAFPDWKLPIASSSATLP